MPTRKEEPSDAVVDLCAALRSARRNAGLTLEDLSDSELGPRNWSVSHFSKVERAKEVPTGDLVHFYERITEAASGSLLGLWEAISGEEYLPDDEEKKRTPDWVMDRLEMELDLTSHPARLLETRDLVTNRGGLEDYWTIYDPNDGFKHAEDFGFRVELGGTVGELRDVEGTKLVRGQVRFGRALKAGEWIRVRFEHTFPAEGLPPTLNFTTHSTRTREVILTVRFAQPVRVARFENVFAEFVPTLSSVEDKVLSSNLALAAVPQAADLSTISRFTFPRPGMYSGVLWGD